MKRCYIHIGMHKTGTSAIEKFLFGNKALLKEVDVLYPETGLVPGGMHHLLAFPLYDHIDPYYQDVMQGVTERGIWTDLSDELNASGHDIAILSSDIFMAIHDQHALRRIRHYLKRCEIKIVLYLRRQDVWLESNYNQQVKSHGYTGTFNEFLASPPNYLDYRFFTDRWGNVFDHKNLIIRVYEKAQMPHGLYRDFMDAVGILWNDNFIVPERSVNPSIPSIYIELIRKLNMLNISDKKRQKVFREITNNLENTGEKELSIEGMLTFSQRQEILNRYEQPNSYIAKQYLFRKNGKLFFEDPLQDGGVKPEPIITSSDDSRLFYFSDQSHRVIRKALKEN